VQGDDPAGDAEVGGAVRADRDAGVVVVEAEAAAGVDLERRGAGVGVDRRPEVGALTTPGFARVDVNARGCRLRWTNRTERAPSVVPKLSTATGLIYTYTRDPDPLPIGQPELGPNGSW
jgi:hypothetical protein